MKKLCFSVLLTFFAGYGLLAQNVNFGLTGGYFLGSSDLSIGGFDIGNTVSDLKFSDGSGFFVGLLVDLEAIDKFHIQPEAVYTNVSGDASIVVPVMAKYYIADVFNIQFGPQLDFALNLPDLYDTVMKKVGFGLAVGAGFDINDMFAIQGKYAFGLSERFESGITDVLGDFGSILSPSLKTNMLQIGLVYKFK